MVVHARNPSIQKMEAEKFQVWGQPGLYNETLYQKKKKKKKKT
jgi:hypothetical protein